MIKEDALAYANDIVVLMKRMKWKKYCGTYLNSVN